MSSPVHVLAFAGSLRKGSFNRALLRAAQDLAPEDMTIEIFDLAPIPLFNADVEAQGTPEPVVHFKQRIANADALLIATPEYNYSVTGVLKNALDWASRRMSPSQPPAINHKPAAIIGAGGGHGTLRSQLHLREILMHNDVRVMINPQLMAVRARNHFDDEGNLTDEETRERLKDVLAGLLKWTRIFQKASS